MLGTHARQLSDAAQQNQNDTLMDHNEAMLQVLGQARSGLDAAYIQLRELLRDLSLKNRIGQF